MVAEIILIQYGLLLNIGTDRQFAIQNLRAPRAQWVPKQHGGCRVAILNASFIVIGPVVLIPLFDSYCWQSYQCFERVTL